MQSTKENGFEDRLALVREYNWAKIEYARPLEHEICKGVNHLREELHRLESLGTERMMLISKGFSPDA